MAFLDNSGDIILDAVLTDTGRMRMAKGDGTFRITKFALADDEINYALYDKNNSSGSAYYDLQILQSPVLEAFTNNGSTMKSKLLSITRQDLLYLPMLKLNTQGASARFSLSGGTEGTFVVAVDSDTVKSISGDTDNDTSTGTAGVINGNSAASQTTGPYVRIDQGLDTTEVSHTLVLDPDLRETQYLVEMDDRLGTLVAGQAAKSATKSFTDDDNIATYYLTENTDSEFVTSLTSTDDSSINGPRGSRLKFRIASTMSLKTNSYLFDVLGSSGAITIGSLVPGTDAYRFIDSIVSVTGVTTGYRIDIPVRYVKKS
jgi:hypothetical protein